MSLVGFKRDQTFVWIIRTSTAMQLCQIRLQKEKKDITTPASGHQPITDIDRQKFSSGIFFPWKMPFCRVQVLCSVSVYVFMSVNLLMDPASKFAYLVSWRLTQDWESGNLRAVLQNGLLANLFKMVNLLPIATCNDQENIPHN